MDNMDGLYIPTVTPKNIEGEDKKSTDVQGASQTGTPEFALEWIFCIGSTDPIVYRDTAW